MGVFSPSRIKDVAGQDGCSSIKINERTMMWTFGDTIIGTWSEPPSVVTTFEDSAVFRSMLSNSIAFSTYPDDSSIQNLPLTFARENGTVMQFIPYKKNENPMKLRFWALDGIRVGPKVYIYYVRITTDLTDKAQPFKVAGMGITSWMVPSGWKIGDPVRFFRERDLLRGDVPTFGDSVIIKDSYLYLIGHKKTSPSEISAYIARVSSESLLDGKAYEYLRTDGTWATRLEQASPFFNDVSGELSLSYNENINSYLITYCSLSGDIRTGCFTDFKNLVSTRLQIIYRPRKLSAPKQRPFIFYYSAKEILSTSSNMYIIYINPAIYQPILVRIPYSQIRCRQ